MESLTQKLLTDSQVEQIEMPENLAVAMRVMQQRAECQSKGCDFDYVNYDYTIVVTNINKHRS
jgi:hypothetical protein